MKKSIKNKVYITKRNMGWLSKSRPSSVSSLSSGVNPRLEVDSFNQSNLDLDSSIRLNTRVNTISNNNNEPFQVGPTNFQVGSTNYQVVESHNLQAESNNFQVESTNLQVVESTSFQAESTNQLLKSYIDLKVDIYSFLGEGISNTNLMLQYLSNIGVTKLIFYPGRLIDHISTTSVSYTHLTLPTSIQRCRSRWSPYH